MAYLLSVERAKEEIARLQKYVELMETYVPDTLEKCIIFEYAKHRNLDRTTDAVNEYGYKIEQRPIERSYIVSVIKRKSNDELHRLVRSSYMTKTKSTRAYGKL